MTGRVLNPDAAIVNFGTGYLSDNLGSCIGRAVVPDQNFIHKVQHGHQGKPHPALFIFDQAVSSYPGNIHDLLERYR